MSLWEGFPNSSPQTGAHRVGTEGKDTLDGTDGKDLLEGRAGDDFLRGFKGNDLLKGDEGNDLLVGDEGNDTLSGGTGMDHLHGGHGDDTYLWGAEAGSDFIWDYSGSDTIFIDANPADVRLSKFMSTPGGPLFIHLGNSSLSINDYFNMGENGGYIDNIAFKDGTVWHMQEVLAVLGQTAPPPPPPPPAGEYLIGTAGDDTLNGGTGNDTLDGRAGDDVLYGGKGNDVYIWGAGGGNDLIQDGGGADTVRILASSTAVELTSHLDGTLVISLNGQKLTIRNYLATGNEGRHIEKLTFSDGVTWDLNKVLEILKGGTPPPPPPAGKYLLGDEGNDTLQGGSGQDTLDGSLGDDALFGGTGNDVYIWGQGGGYDLIQDAGGSDVVKIGAASSDVDLLMHLDGTLVISTDSGSLTIRNYLATSDNGGHIEKLVFSDGAEWDRNKVLQAIASPEPEPEGQTIVGDTDHNLLIGSINDDTILGGLGNDTLNGGGGGDVLIGGQGTDALIGGAGDDLFCFMKKSELGIGSRRDVIVDFTSGEDLIDLGGIDANSATRKNDAFKIQLKSKAAFTKAGQLHYDAKTGILSGNTDKDTAAEFQILIKNKPKALYLHDFIL